jgi:hypothetical protein
MIRQALLFGILVIVMVQLPLLALAQSPGTPDIGELKSLIQAGLSQVYGHDSNKAPFKLKQTRVGDTASGVEVARTNDILSIDVTPCASQPTIVAFTKPYQETPVSDQRCGDKTYKRLQVIQQ